MVFEGECQRQTVRLRNVPHFILTVLVPVTVSGQVVSGGDG